MPGGAAAFMGAGREQSVPLCYRWLKRLCVILLACAAAGCIWVGWQSLEQGPGHRVHCFTIWLGLCCSGVCVAWYRATCVALCAYTLGALMGDGSSACIVGTLRRLLPAMRPVSTFRCG